MSRYPLPMAALDNRQGIVGMSGSGKTYAVGTAVERLLHEGRRVGIIDALGVWYGLRLAPDGKAPGFDVIIFGGPHADIPITPNSGALIGETVAGTKDSWILDLSTLGTKATERRFLLAFLEALYRHQHGDQLHLVVDEADLWAPQKLLDKEGEATKLLGTMENIVRRGRVKGFIPWLITQRPAVLSKDVLSQMDGLAIFKLTSSQDRKAVGAWVEGQADIGQWKKIHDALPGKELGHAVIWQPMNGLLIEDAPFPAKATYDSSATPKRGQKRQTKELKPLDLGRLKDRLATVEAEVKANDPKALRAEVAQARAELTKLQGGGAHKNGSGGKSMPADAGAIAAAEARGVAAEHKRLTAEFATAEKRIREELAGEERAHWEPILDVLIGQVEASSAALKDALRALTGKNDVIAATLKNAARGLAKPGKGGSRPTLTYKSTPPPAPRQAAATSSDRPPASTASLKTSTVPATAASIGDSLLSGPEQRIVDALATWQGMGHGQPSNAQVAWLARYSPISTSYTNPRGALKSKGLLSYPSPDAVALTEEGLSLAQPIAIDGRLLDFVLANLPGPEQRILRAAADVYPAAGSNEDIAAAANYSASSTSYTNPRGALKSKQLIDYPASGMVQAVEWLFAEPA